MPTSKELLAGTKKAAAVIGGAAVGLTVSTLAPRPQNGSPFFDLIAKDVNTQAVEIAQYTLFGLAGGFIAYLAANTTAGTLAEDTRRSWLAFLAQLMGFMVSTVVAVELSSQAYPQTQPTTNATTNEALAALLAAFTIGGVAYLSSIPLANGCTRANNRANDASSWAKQALTWGSGPALAIDDSFFIRKPGASHDAGQPLLDNQPA
ncbi:MAG: hypothetical protein K0R66_1700 [Gammaproteobacteria bacterium]|jgi:hypothetical protein|nr:hypothetical protein [Gammaproteobacteria bacterium]